MIMSHHFNRVHMGQNYGDHDMVEAAIRQDAVVAGTSVVAAGSREPEESVGVEEGEAERVQPVPVPVPAKTKGKSKRPGRPLQDFFEFHYDADAVKFALCKLCRTGRNVLVKIRMKNSNTTGIQKHLLRAHKKEYFEVNPGKSKPEPARLNDYSYGIGMDNVTTMLETSAEETNEDYDEANHQVAPSEASTSAGRRRAATGSPPRLRLRRGKVVRMIGGGQETEVEPMAPAAETFTAFGAFVAAELRSLRHQRNQKKLKLMIQKCIIQVAEEDSND